MSYQLYRNSTIGIALEETLAMYVQNGTISQHLANKMLLQFDKTINQALPSRVKNRLTFKSGRLRTYRFCDNVWTFILTDVEFREMSDVLKVDKLKIVACDGKGNQNIRDNDDA